MALGLGPASIARKGGKFALKLESQKIFFAFQYFATDTAAYDLTGQLLTNIYIERAKKPYRCTIVAPP